MSINAYSIIIDIADNHGDFLRMGLRAVEFYYQSSSLGNIVVEALATSEFSTSYSADKVFNTTLPKTGAALNNSWLSNGATTNQRIIANLSGSGVDIDEIRIVNYHDSGGTTTRGAQNIKIYARTDAHHSDTTYDASIPNSSLLLDTVLPEHVASDIADEQTLILPEPSYNITYNGNSADSGTPPVDSTDYNENDTVTVLGQSDLVKANYTFYGWNTEADGTGTNYLENETFSMGASNIILYAQWNNYVQTDGIISYVGDVLFNPSSAINVVSVIEYSGELTVLSYPITVTGIIDYTGTMEVEQMGSAATSGIVVYDGSINASSSRPITVLGTINFAGDISVQKPGISLNGVIDYTGDIDMERNYFITMSGVISYNGDVFTKNPRTSGLPSHDSTRWS